VAERAHSLRFGWLSPSIGNRWGDHKPVVVEQAKYILPTVNDHFDSMWVADHFWGFDAKADSFVEAWTSLTWLAAKFPDVQLCHHVLGHGCRPPALSAKMAAPLQVFSENRLTLGIGTGWRGDEYEAYGYDFPKPSVRFAQLEEVVEICRLMWTQDDPSFEGEYYSISGAAAPPLPEVAPPVCIGATGEKIGLPSLVASQICGATSLNGRPSATLSTRWRPRPDATQPASKTRSRSRSRCPRPTKNPKPPSSFSPEARGRRRPCRVGLRQSGIDRANLAVLRTGDSGVALIRSAQS
jgi:hypothetical protein